MDTNKPKQSALLEWIREGVEAGRLKLRPIQDENGRILSISIILDDEDKFPPLSAFDPRKTRPL